MELARVVLFTGLEDTVLTGGFDCHIRAVRMATLRGQEPGRRLILATIPLDTAVLSSDGRTDLDCEERRTLDDAITVLRDLFTIAQRRPVQIFSVQPSIGLIGEPTELARFVGTRLGRGPARASAEVLDDMSIGELPLALLADREAGVALLAEAFPRAIRSGGARSSYACLKARSDARSGSLDGKCRISFRTDELLTTSAAKRFSDGCPDADA